MADRANNAESNPDMQKTLGRLILAVYIIGALALGAYVVHFAFVHPARISSDPGDWGTLGDYFGGLLNPVVSFATLVVAYAVWKQQKEELKATKEALEEQAKTAEQQRQEQRFFDLLALYQATVASITLVGRMSPRNEIPVQYSGKEAIAHFFRSTADSVEPMSVFLRYGFYRNGSPAPRPEDFSWLDQIPEKLEKQDLLKAWGNDEIASTFDHYFRVLFRVLAESENLLGDQHFKYVKLLRAQLSRYELTLIGLNLWLDEEGTKMIPLAEKYGVLKHLPNGKLREQLRADLPPAIFGRRFAATCIPNAPSEVSPC